MADKNKDNMSLDDILSSIRSSVEESEPEQNEQVPQPKKQDGENIEKIEKAIFDGKSDDKSDEIIKNIQKDLSNQDLKQNAEESISESILSAQAEPKAAPLSEEDLQQQTQTPQAEDEATTPLSDIMELGDQNAIPPMVSGRSAFNVEESIKSILEILEKHKDELPDEFFMKQDEFIKTWLNTHLPEMVEKIVQKEIKHIFEYVYKQK